MFLRYSFLLLMVLVSLAVPGMGQDPPTTDDAGKTVKKDEKDGSKKKGHAEEDPAALPEPFEKIAGNFGEIETRSDGLVSVKSVRYAQAEGTGMAVIWTIRANRDMTFRRLLQLIKPMRDVRFYIDYTKTRTQLHSTELAYPALVDQAASNNEIMRRDMTMPVWVPMEVTDRRKVLGQHATSVEFTYRKRDRRKR